MAHVPGWASACWASAEQQLLNGTHHQERNASQEVKSGLGPLFLPGIILLVPQFFLKL